MPLTELLVMEWRESFSSVIWRVKISSKKQAGKFHLITYSIRNNVRAFPGRGWEHGEIMPVSTSQTGPTSSHSVKVSGNSQGSSSALYWLQWAALPVSVSQTKWKQNTPKGLTSIQVLWRIWSIIARVPLIYKLKSAWTMSPSDTPNSCMYSGDWTKKINFPV